MTKPGRKEEEVAKALMGFVRCPVCGGDGIVNKKLFKELPKKERWHLTCMTCKGEKFIQKRILRGNRA